MARIGVTFRNPKKLHPYARAVEMAGAEPAPISPANPQPLDTLDGLLISGGTDVNPARYGQAPDGAEGPFDDERDTLETLLLRRALDRDMPVLAICRGMQLFNVVHGGTLIQHLRNAKEHLVRSPDPGERVHDVRVFPGTKLAEIAGNGEIPVNSRHHQAVASLGTGLRVAAVSGDGLVEALESPEKRFAIAVQWHPEDQIAGDPVQRRLFEALVRAVY